MPHCSHNHVIIYSEFQILIIFIIITVIGNEINTNCKTNSSLFKKNYITVDIIGIPKKIIIQKIPNIKFSDKPLFGISLALSNTIPTQNQSNGSDIIEINAKTTNIAIIIYANNSFLSFCKNNQRL